MLQFYSLFDKKTLSYSQPMPYKHVEEALRALRMAMEDPKSSLARHAADYALYLVGHFDQATGHWMPANKSGEPSFSTELLALFPSIPPQGAINAKA